MRFNWGVAIFLAFLLCFNTQASQDWQPKAANDAVIIVDDVRFTVLTPSLIRMEYAQAGKFNDEATLVVVNRHLPVPKFSQKQQGGILEISTSQLTLKYRLGSGPFNADNLSIVSSPANSQAFDWQPGQENTGNLGGTARTLDGMNGGIDWNGKELDLGQGIVSKSGWYLLDDSNSHLLTGIGEDQSESKADKPWPWVKAKDKNQQHQDWYFFGHGVDFKRALKEYTQIAGKIPMPPKYAFGYWWSRYWVYSDRELKDLMQQMRDYDIPIDVLVIDMDWHLTHGGLKDIHNPKRDPFGELLGWTGYTWNRDLFPEPEAFLDWTEDFHLKTALNLHPASGIPPMEEQYEAFAKDYGFDTSDKEYIPYRLAEQKWAESYVDTILRPLEDQGVDFWWLDWQQFPESKVVDGLSNTWWLNYVFFTDMERQDTRPLLFHRWGGMGNHRYQIGFSGDDKISWESLEYQSYFTATAANVGYGYWSHDIGGHASGELDKDAELYLRWLQFGVFSPILRTHSAKISSIERRFWQYPEHFEAMRDLVKLRYRLTPYIYTAARQAYDEGISIVRPMYYDSPNAKQAFDAKYQYMFGDDLLVAPIAKPVSDDNLLAEQQVWLPEGQWYEWYTGSMLEGNQNHQRFYSENEVPVFAKAGAIIPMHPDVEHLQQQINEFNLVIVPGQKGDAVVYEDNGDSNAYQKGEFATTRISHFAKNDSERVVLIEPRDGDFEGALAERQFSLVLPSTFPVETVTVNGKKLSAEALRYDAEQLANIVDLSKVNATERLLIELSWSPQYAGLESMLDGKIGLFKRLTTAVSALKIEVARSSWWATLPNPILGAEQTPTKIGYDLNNVLPLLREFDKNISQFNDLIKSHKDARPEVAERYIRFLSPVGVK